MGRPVQLCYRRKSIIVFLFFLPRSCVCSWTHAHGRHAQLPQSMSVVKNRTASTAGVVVEVVKAPSHVHMRPLRCGAVLSARQNPHGVCAVRLGGLVAFVHSPHMRIASGCASRYIPTGEVSFCPSTMGIPHRLETSIEPQRQERQRAPNYLYSVPTCETTTRTSPRDYRGESSGAESRLCGSEGNGSVVQNPIAYLRKLGNRFSG